MIDKEYKNTLKYLFFHWCAFQVTAFNLNAWKPKYLLHDIHLLWLRIIFRDHKKRKEYHKKNSNHHPEYFINYPIKNFDWEAMLIDWECEKLINIDKKPNGARIRLSLELATNIKYGKIIWDKCIPILTEWNI